ncbi:MAG TPA: MFS transporter [Kofleriaceae bacterium]|jgi:predicted MFS family arabinose efflux permease|nr:MFS transporter [Kofleriaceae bacterium]
MIRGRRAILVLLTALNFLNFIDRAVIAAVLKPMTEQLDLSNAQAGALNTAFLIGYFLTCPLFGARADKGVRKRMIALGVLIWSAATVASGLATGFWTLLAARIVVGVGEASFAVLAPTIIDDITPAERKGSALSVFYLAVPLGYALGYIFGGQIAKQWEAHMGHDLIAGWRASFLLVGGPGIALALTCLAIAEPSRKLLHAQARLIDGLRELARIPQLRRGVLGYCAFTAAVAGFSYYAPSFVQNQFKGLDVGSANLWFGVVLIAGGTLGTLIGGRYANRALSRNGVTHDTPHDAPNNRRAVNALLKICAIGMAVAAPVSLIGFFLPRPLAFFLVSFVVDTALFVTTSPVSIVCLRSVPSERRASAIAAQIFAIHLFGDLWSAPLLGVLLDHLDPRIAMTSLPLTFAWAVYIWWPRHREAGPAAGAGGLPEARVHPAT